MKPFRVVAYSSLLLCCSSLAGAADKFEEVRQYVRSALIERSVPSIAVAVAQDGKVVWQEGFGWADREKRVAASEHTMYSLASISKPITTTGLMTLVQAGKVDLDKPANDYLGAGQLRARVGDARQATVRRVANHTAGLPLHYQFFYADEPYRAPSMDETILRYGNLITPPGEQYQYSNLGYGVLDHIITRVSGQSYAEFMRREVFLPLGLTRMTVDIGPGLEPYAATRYGSDGLPIPFYEFDHPGASAVYSSAHDLVRFGMFHLKAHLRDQKAILTDASIDEMHRATGQDAKGASGYGIGFSSREQHGYRVVGHTGGMGGVSTQMRLFPDQRIAVVVLSNGSSGLPSEVADRILTRMLPKWKLAEKRAPAAETPFATPDALRGTWKGTLSTYVKDVPVELRFLPGNEVHAKVGDQLSALVNEPRFEDGAFEGELISRVGTPDTDRYADIIRLSLRLRGDALNGAAIALLHAESPRVRNALTQWIELTRQKE